MSVSHGILGRWWREAVKPGLLVSRVLLLGVCDVTPNQLMEKQELPPGPEMSVTVSQLVCLVP